MKLFVISAILAFVCYPFHVYGELSSFGGNTCNPENTTSYELVWSDEFDYEGSPNPEYWTSEHGYLRNEEDQWYQKENVKCQDGMLHIEARQDCFANPMFRDPASYWAESRKKVKYTSASINTSGLKSWQYGRFEIRAKIPVGDGLWPAIWLLGVEKEWPSCGEIDIMEYYQNSILANAAWGSNQRWNAKWASSQKPITHFLKKDPEWADKFHVWRMDWTPEYIKIYLDDELLNAIDITKTINADGTNPFQQPHYLLLNLALGGINGGNPESPEYPAIYYIDYVRVYQRDIQQ